MSFYTHTDKQSGDGLALTNWNDLSSAVAGNSGLTLALNPADKIGIGNSNPQNKLEISTSNDQEGIVIRRPSGNNSGGLYFTYDTNTSMTAGVQADRNLGGSNNGGLQIMAANNRSIQFYVKGGQSGTLLANTEEAMRIAGNGRVGIGTTNPSQRLHVNGNIQANQFIGDGSGLTNLPVSSTWDQNGSAISYASGNVGIGTTNPQNKLEVSTSGDGDGIIIRRASRNNSGGLYFTYGTNTSLVAGVQTDRDLGGSNNGGLQLIASNTRPIQFYVKGSQSGTSIAETEEAMRIASDGNVGIGTSSPQAPLSINVSNGKKSGPDSAMHITNDCILFGGDNNGKQTDSAQISAGKHIENSLNITGMASGTDRNSRKVDIWSEYDFNIHGNSNHFRITMDANNIVFHMRNSYHGGSDSWSKIRWNGDGNWDSYSDRRLKTNIENEKNILERLLKLDVKSYNWKSNPDAEFKSIGFIAQEVKPLFPALVGEMEDPETKETTLSLKSANFGMLAVGAIKELKEEQDKKIKVLERKVAALGKKLKAA